MKTRIRHPQTKQSLPHISGGVLCDGWLFVSGQGPLDMSTKAVVPGTIEEETRLTLQNLDAILGAAGCSREDVVKCTCYLSDLGDFAGFDAAYREFFSCEVPPARTTLQAPLLKGIKVEIDAIAHCPGGVEPESDGPRDDRRNRIA